MRPLDPGVEDLLTVELLLASQLPGQGFSMPCRRLAAAVVEQALEDARRDTEVGRDARRWIASDETTWPFAFVSLCHALGLEAEAVRQGLERRRPKAA